MSWTVTPSVDSEGNVTSFETEQQTEGHWRGSEKDFVYNDLTGETHHVFENVELNEDEGGYDSDDYWDAVVATEPDVHDALSWAASNLSKDFLSDYNAALDSDNHKEVHQYLQMILEEYRSSSPNQEDTYEPQEDTYEEEDEALTQEESEYAKEVLTGLSQNEPAGEEYANEWQSAVDTYQAAGDEVAAGVAAATAAFHSGQVSAEDAINWALQNFNARDLDRVYRMFTQ